MLELAILQGLCERCCTSHTCSNALVKVVINPDFMLNWLFGSTYIDGFNLCVFR